MEIEKDPEIDPKKNPAFGLYTCIKQATIKFAFAGYRGTEICLVEFIRKGEKILIHS